jgi:protein SCO1/2
VATPLTNIIDRGSRPIMGAWMKRGTAAWAVCLAAASLGVASVSRADEEADEHRHHHHHAAEPGATSPTAVTRSERTYTVPDLQLEDADGSAVALRSLLETDRPVMLDFIYTSCTAVCPLLSEIFAQVQRQLGPDSAKLRMVSISIDPEYDTPRVLRGYAQIYHPGPQWRFLTGKAADVAAVQQAFDAYKANKMDHAPLVFLRASKHSAWIRFDGLVEPAALSREVRAMDD